MSANGQRPSASPFLDEVHSRDTYAEVRDASVREGWATVVPLFDFVYHDRIVFWANYTESLNRDRSDYHRLALARALVWGKIPNYNWPARFSDPGLDRDALKFLKKIVAARADYARKFLVDGRMIAPPCVIESPLLTPSAARPAKGVLTAGAPTPTGVPVPTLQYAFRQSPDGDVGCILTNAGADPVPLRMALKRSRLPLRKAGRWRAYAFVDGQRRELEDSLQDAIKLEDTVEPAQVWVIVVAPTDARRDWR